ncbi:hypothetical protein CRUP_024156 [Coryphaenoides rupestris]|nr:hypothetical protein CRUP_024156 [Coryphaenoides rupestris]
MLCWDECEAGWRTVVNHRGRKCLLRGQSNILFGGPAASPAGIRGSPARVPATPTLPTPPTPSTASVAYSIIGTPGEGAGERSCSTPTAATLTRDSTRFAFSRAASHAEEEEEDGARRGSPSLGHRANSAPTAGHAHLLSYNLVFGGGGKVFVSCIVDYLRHRSEDSGLEELCNMLDPERKDVSIDLDTYHSVMKEWIDDCRNNGETSELVYCVANLQMSNQRVQQELRKLKQ